MEALNGNGFGFSARPQVIDNRNSGPYRDPYREYVYSPLHVNFLAK